MSAFDWALDELRSGARVQRLGWNGRGMFVTLMPGYPIGVRVNANTADAIGVAEGSIQKFTSYLMLRAVDGSFGPWAPTAADLFAEDWQRLSVARAPEPAEAVAAGIDEEEDADDSAFDGREQAAVAEDERRHEKALDETPRGEP